MPESLGRDRDPPYAEWMDDIVAEREVQCRSSVEELWSRVADTERLNRAIGLGALTLIENDDETAARYLVRTVTGGLPLEYEERPYEWVLHRQFSVLRVVRKGPTEFLENSFFFEETASGCTVRIRIRTKPKHWAIVPVVRWEVSRFLNRIADLVREDDQLLQQDRSPPPASLLQSRCDRQQLTIRAEKLYSATADPTQRQGAERIVELLEQGTDFELDRLRPYALADQWQLPRRAVLAACLQATLAGLLELRWDLICPSCHTASERQDSLTAIGESGSCHLCDINFDVALDDAVEATFTPNAAVRGIDHGPYCIGGPLRTPHVLAQVVVPKSGNATLPAPAEPGSYRLFIRGGQQIGLRVREQAPAGVSLHAGDLPQTLELAPGAELSIEGTDSGETHAKIERVGKDTSLITAHDLSTLSEFRQQFGSQLLRPGLTLRVGCTTLLFTDLTDSTAMYASIGDARAFGVVQSHFDLLDSIIRQHQGTIIKTIGDAIMAAFNSEEHGIRCALEMQRRFPEFRTQNTDARLQRLKIGVHSGPCYSVTANGILDYFGQSVNVAARLQGFAGAGEVVLLEESAHQARERGWLGTTPIKECITAELKGVGKSLRVARLCLDPPE